MAETLETPEPCTLWEALSSLPDHRRAEGIGQAFRPFSPLGAMDASP